MSAANSEQNCCDNDQWNHQLLVYQHHLQASPLHRKEAVEFRNFDEITNYLASWNM